MKDAKNNKLLYNVTLNESDAIFSGSLDSCCAYVKQLYGRKEAIKKILDGGIKIKPAGIREGNLC